MTRIKAYDLPLTWKNVKEKQTKILIDTIFDDFESRICKNCKYWGSEHEHISHPNYLTCTNIEGFTYMLEPHMRDGCNNYEKR